MVLSAAFDIGEAHTEATKQMATEESLLHDIILLWPYDSLGMFGTFIEILCEFVVGQ